MYEGQPRRNRLLGEDEAGSEGEAIVMRIRRGVKAPLRPGHRASERELWSAGGRLYCLDNGRA